MESEAIVTPASRDTARIAELTALVSELEERNSNLLLLEDTLQRNTALFEALVANNVAGITLTGANRRIVRVIRGLTGLAPSGLAGILIESLVTPEDRHILIDCYRQLLARQSYQLPFEVRANRPDGSFICLSGTLTDMLDNPNVQAIVCNYADVTEKKRAALNRGEFALLLDKSDYSVFSIDADGNILTWNKSACRMFGYAEHEIVGRHIGILIPRELRTEEQEARQLILEAGAPVNLRTVRLAKDGTLIPAVIDLAMLRDESGAPLGIFDLSRRA